MRRIHILSAVLCLAFGCSKKPLESVQERIPGKPQTWFSCHFVGMKQLGSNSPAAKFNSVWRLPETRNLRDQILRKLAATPEQWLQLELKPPPADRSALVRPILDDLIETESYYLLQGMAGQTPEGALAVRLDDTRAEVWQTNLWQLMIAWEADPPAPAQVAGYNGWEARKHDPPNLIRVIRAGQWLVLGWGNDLASAQQAMLGEIKKGTAPLATSDNWLETEADFVWLAERLQLPDWVKGPSGQWPLAKLSLYGKEDKLRAKMRLLYSEQVRLPLEAWDIPTNIIQNTDRSPLISFSASQGISPWLDRTKVLQGLDLQPLPNQLYVWAQSDVAFQTYSAFPVQNGSNSLARFAANLPSFLNTNFPQSGFSKMHWESNSTEIVGKGLPFIVPYLRSVSRPGKEFLTGGLFPVVPTTNRLPSELMAQFAGRTNLVYYDWEITQVRLNQWIALTQFFGYILPDLAGGAKPPLVGGEINIPGLKWLQAVSKQLTNTVAGLGKAEPQEDNTVTEVTITAPQEVTVVRSSHLGFTGVELVALARWFNDPVFPLFRRQGSAPTNQAPAKIRSNP